MTEEIQKTDTPSILIARDIEHLIEGLLEAEAKLEHGYARLGFLLKEVSEKKYWQVLGYDSFGKYMAHLSEKYNKGRSQLYHYFGTVKELAPYVTEEQLNQMGIAKAAELKGAAKVGRLSEEIITQATDPNVTVKDVRKLLFDATDPQPESKGDWLDLDFSFYVSPDEKELIMSAIQAAIRAGDIGNDLKPWQRNKKIVLVWCMEFLGSNSEVLP